MTQKYAELPLAYVVKMIRAGKANTITLPFNFKVSGIHCYAVATFDSGGYRYRLINDPRKPGDQKHLVAVGYRPKGYYVSVSEGTLNANGGEMDPISGDILVRPAKRFSRKQMGIVKMHWSKYFSRALSACLKMNKIHDQNRDK